MTQITATLGPEANPTIIRKVLENMKGVVDISIKKDTTNLHKKDQETEDWIKKLHKLQNNVDKSVIDLNDERTQYIMR